MIKKLLYELYKNFKVIFRSKSSVSLLILGPLVLILLVGLAFSGDKIHDITIGVHSNEYEDLQPLLSNFSEIGEIIRYSSIEDCIKDLQLELTHICLDFSDGFVSNEQEEIPSGQIAFYYDNTRKKLSNEIVDAISSFFGNTSEQISIESAKTIFKNIEAMVVFLSDRNQDITDLVNESENIKADLTIRKEQLVEFQDDFLPRYYKIKSIQSRINNLTDNINNSYSEFIYESSKLREELSLLTTQIGLYKHDTEYYLSKVNNTLYLLKDQATSLQNYDFSNLTNITMINRTTLLASIPNISNNITVFLGMLSDEDYLNLLVLSIDNNSRKVISQIDRLITLTNNTYNEFMQLKAEFDAMIFQLDEIKLMLDEEIKATDEYIKKIDRAVIRINELKEELDSNLANLAKLNPSLAEKLIKPIIQSFEPLIKIKNIKLAFPGLLAQVIIFISILFANIVALSEVNSKAYIRNLIAPVNDILYTLGLLITNLLVVLFQSMVLLLVAQFSFGIDVFQIISPLLAVIMLISLIFIMLGMLFAFIFTNEQTSILTTTFVALTFFLFSDMITPLETMPVVAAKVAALNPFVLVQSVFKKLIVFDIPLDYSARELTLLAIYFCAGLTLLVIATKISNNKRI